MAEHDERAKAAKEEPVGPQHADSEQRPPRPTRAQLSRARARHAVETGWVPAWLRPTGPENRLPVAASILVAMALQIRVSCSYGFYPRLLLPALEIALLVVLTAINPVRLSRETRMGRYMSMALTGLITLDNVGRLRSGTTASCPAGRATMRTVCSAPASTLVQVSRNLPRAASPAETRQR